MFGKLPAIRLSANLKNVVERSSLLSDFKVILMYEKEALHLFLWHQCSCRHPSNVPKMSKEPSIYALGLAYLQSSSLKHHSFVPKKCNGHVHVILQLMMLIWAWENTLACSAKMGANLSSYSQCCNVACKSCPLLCIWIRTLLCQKIMRVQDHRADDDVNNEMSLTWK